MNKEQALDMLEQYANYFATRTLTVNPALRDAVGMPERFPIDGSENKAMRWLGYMQGVAVALNLFTLEEVKEHSRTRKVE